MAGQLTTTEKNRGSLYLTDHLGSTRAVVDDNGNVLETFDYYPFGLLMPKRNTAGANTLEKFTGKERDTEGGLNLDYFGARYYDPGLGRWNSVDPLADDYPAWSPYNYTLSNPINLIDPDGQMVDCPEKPCGFEERVSSYFTQLFTRREDFNSVSYTEQLAKGVGEDLQQGAQQLPGQVKEGALAAGNVIVDGTATTADAISSASIDGVIAGGIMVGAGALITAASDGLASPVGIPLMKYGGGLMTMSNTIGQYSDGISFGAKTIDYVAFDGTSNAMISQGGKALINIAGGKVLDATGAGALRYLESATQATRQVPASYGLRTITTAVTDATKVAPIIIYERLKNQ